MRQILFVALGGAAGALLRYAVGIVIAARPGHWPLSTLLVNVSGSMAIGAIYVLIAERGILHPDWRNVAMVGFLGAFTTFSTFSLEAILLLEAGRWLTGLAYVAASVLLCTGAAAVGMQLTRALAA